MEFLLITLAVILIVVSTLSVLAFVGDVAIKVPFVPVPPLVTARVAALAALSPGEIFYDLGSGDGRVVRAVANKYPKATVYGIERGPFPALLAYLATPRVVYPNAVCLYGDFAHSSLKDTSCVFLYLLPSAIQELLPKLERELPKGARIIACDFPVEGHIPTGTEQVHVGSRIYTLYLYEMGV